MKKLFRLLATLSIAALFAMRADAGETYSAPPPSPELYGTGWYGGIQLGANIYQDRGDTRTFSTPIFTTLTLDPKNDPGFFGGIKIGYVFGSGSSGLRSKETSFTMDGRPELTRH